MKKLLLALALLFAPSVAWGQCNGVFTAGQVCGVEATSTSKPPHPVAPPPINAAGYTYGLGQGTIAIAGGGTGYAARDQVTLACANTTFTTNPVVAITHVTGGVADGVSVVNSGVATSISAYNCTFTQLSTTGGGNGASFTGTLLPNASVLSLPTLLTGGAASNGNTFIGGGTPGSTLGTGENTFVGDFAGASFGGTAQGNTAFGSYSCGIGAGVTATGNFNLCVGRNAGRNISGAANTNTLVGDSAAGNESGVAFTGQNNVVLGSAGLSMFTASENVVLGVGAGLAFTTANGNTLVGFNAGTALTTGFNTIVGFQAGLNIGTSSSGGNNVILGADAGQNITTGFSNTIIGQGVASTTLLTGGDNVVIGTSNGCDTAGSSDGNTLTLCAGAGTLLHITGGQSPSSAAWTFNGASYSFPGTISAGSTTAGSFIAPIQISNSSNTAGTGVGIQYQAQGNGGVADVWQLGVVNDTFILAIGSIGTYVTVDRNGNWTFGFGGNLTGISALTTKRITGSTSSAPTASSCTGFSLATGSSDVDGKVSFNAATTCSIAFGTAFTNAPFCTVAPGSGASTSVVSASTAIMSVSFGTSQSAMSYHCLGT